MIVPKQGKATITLYKVSVCVWSPFECRKRSPSHTWRIAGGVRGQVSSGFSLGLITTTWSWWEQQLVFGEDIAPTSTSRPACSMSGGLGHCFLSYFQRSSICSESIFCWTGFMMIPIHLQPAASMQALFEDMDDCNRSAANFGELLEDWRGHGKARDRV